MSTRAGLLFVALVCLSVAAGLSAYRRQNPPPPQVVRGQKFHYCPECGLEMTCPPELEARPMFCPHCGMNRRMQLNAFSHGGSGPSRPTNWLLVGIAFALPAALAVGIYLQSRSREPQIDQPGEPAPRFACPGCGHEMEYGVFVPGATAVCPSCLERFVVPDRADLRGSDEPPVTARIAIKRQAGGRRRKPPRDEPPRGA